MSALIACAAKGCHETTPRVTDRTGRPQPPVSWYEVEVGRTILFAHSKRCAQKVAVGLNVGRPTSDVPIGE